MPLLTDWDAKNCYDDLYFDTAAVEERRNWTAVFKKLQRKLFLSIFPLSVTKTGFCG